MKKRIYRAVPIKNVNESTVFEQVSGQQIMVGMDVAKKDFYAALMQESGEVVVTVKWKHPQESRDFVGFVRRLPASSVQVAMEPSGTYGDALRGLLQEAGVEVFLVSPKRVHDAKEVFDGVPSLHDAKSAALIARLHLQGLSGIWAQRTAGERGLAAAVNTMEMYEDELRRNVNRLEARLARYWPEVTELLDLDSATLLTLLATFGDPREVVAHGGQARALMRRVGRGLLKEDKVDQVLQAAAETVGVKMIEAERQSLKELATELLRNRKSARQARTEVERLGQKVEVVANMSNPVGKATAAVLVVSAGEPTRFESAAAYVKALGLNLKERSSGKHVGQLKITKRGSGRARKYLYLAVLRMIQSDAVFRTWYAMKVAGGMLKGKAIVALMRKLTAGLWHVARGNAFDSRRLFDVKRFPVLPAELA